MLPLMIKLEVSRPGHYLSGSIVETVGRFVSSAGLQWHDASDDWRLWPDAETFDSFELCILK